MKTKLIILFAGLLAMNSYAALHTETIQYKQGDTTCEGYLAYDDIGERDATGCFSWCTIGWGWTAIRRCGRICWPSWVTSRLRLIFTARGVRLQRACGGGGASEAVQERPPVAPCPG